MPGGAHRHACGIEWRDPATVGAIVDLLRSGGVPASVHTLYMDMLVRFGRSDATVIADVLPLVGAFHLKFWDLDDSDDRVSGPIRDLAALLRGTGVHAARSAASGADTSGSTTTPTDASTRETTSRWPAAR